MSIGGVGDLAENTEPVAGLIAADRRSLSVERLTIGPSSLGVARLRTRPLPYRHRERGGLLLRRTSVFVCAGGAILASVLGACGSTSTPTSAKPSRGFTAPATGARQTGANISVNLKEKGLVLTDGTAVVTVDYSCPPTPGNNRVFAWVLQGPKTGNGNAPATCDDLLHTANIQTIPGPFRAGGLTPAGTAVQTSAGSKEMSRAVLLS